MSPSALALLISALSASGASDGTLAASSIPVPLELVEEAMPPPPDKVVLTTSYYGTVTVDHQAHLRRKAHCKDCHGPGPVSPIAFTPKLAHDRCRGCHQELQKGPTDCKGCHVMPPKEAVALTAGAAPAGGPGAKVDVQPVAAADGASASAVAGAPVATTGPEAVAGVAASPSTSPPVLAGVATASDDEKEARAFHRTVLVGLAAGTGFGLSARLVSRQGDVGLSYGIDRLGETGPTRTVLLVGVGPRLPIKLPPGLGLFAEGVAGLDVVSSPSVDVMPALGARLGLEWAPAWLRQLPLSFSVTGLLDAFHEGLLSPACLYATIAVGAPLQRR